MHYHGPQIGMPTLSGQFPDARPWPELRDVLGVFAISGRRALHPRERRELHWQRPGTVWAMDFSKARHAIDGTHGYLLAVREPGQRLAAAAWRPAALAGCGSSGGKRNCACCSRSTQRACGAEKR